MARRQGWSAEVLSRLADFESLGELDQATRVALRYAERMTSDANAVDEALYAELQRHFDEAQMVEITAVIGLFNYFNRFNNALQMEPTRAGER